MENGGSLVWACEPAIEHLVAATSPIYIIAFDTCRMLSFGSARLMAARRIDCAVAGAAVRR